MYSYYRQPCPPGTFPYIIQPGDTFYRLALRFRTTVPALISANPLATPDTLQIGQSICIPRQQIYPACPEGNYYTLRSGDTLYGIARTYNISLADLVEANPGINPYMLMVGQVICIPLATPPQTCPPDTTPYVIQRGDTFTKLAQQFNTTVSAIVRVNPTLNPTALLIGQTVCIPRPSLTLPATKNIPVIVEGQTEYRQAKLQRSEQGYYIYVLDRFQFTAEEPGRDLLFSTFDDRFFVRIERLPTNANIEDLRENALAELRLIGTPLEMKGEEIFDPFFRSARFFLHASNPTVSKNIILMEIDGSLFRFTMHLPNAEAAEGIIPSFYAMMKTIGVR